MSLERKPQAEEEIPDTFFDTWRLNARQREDANMDKKLN